MTKAAVLSLTRTAAAELGPSGVRVNAVAPGFVETGMTRRSWTAADGTVDEAERSRLLAAMNAGSPLRMNGDPDDIAWAVLYLAADASRFMTGQVLRPNGGVHMP
jgi:3-oxoacyl-[acyl-carrier protein] reductase